MGLFDSVKRSFSKPAPVHQPDESQRTAQQPEPAPLIVPEIQPADLIPLRRAGQAPKFIDCREPYEWQQVRIPGAHYIPMNSVPNRLAELPADRPIIVFCAHGSRSFGVAYYLREQGFDAYNLTGGITQWHIQGGEVEVSTR